MAENLGKWPSKQGPISKIRPSDGCGRDAVLLAVERWFDFPEFGGYLGNVGLECPCPSLGNHVAPLLPDRQGEEHEPPDNLREHESAKRQLGYKGCHDSAASIIGTSKLSSCLESR
jgi:hypothetical protein